MPTPQEEEIACFVELLGSLSWIGNVAGSVLSAQLGDMHALKLDLVNRAVGRSREGQQGDMEPRTNHKPPDVTETQRDRWEIFGLNLSRVITQDTEEGRWCVCGVWCVSPPAALCLVLSTVLSVNRMQVSLFLSVTLSFHLSFVRPLVSLSFSTYPVSLCEYIQYI